MFLRGLWQRLHTGVPERKSAKKAFSAARNAEIATAARKGDTALVERLRWQYYPAKQRIRWLKGECGPCPPDLETPAT